ncbi:MAG TPA: LUD domain-containing protein [Anaeromyxobacteraceae bacterium]|nr:LUD domain-containing protein [Anaeromyxobacteraceae bacterium]
MSSRETVLSALRRASARAVPRPEDPEPTRFDDPVSHFLEMVKAVGGAASRVRDMAALDAELASLPAWAQAKKAVSLVPGAGRSSLDLASVADPHELEGLDTAVIAGEVAVAENGAVWVPGRNLGPHRAVFVIAEHLVLVVPAVAVVSSMQEAYARIEIERPGYGLFISGPSKTADIEQALVVGAHGARSCTVFVVG